jgi:hypothetical protein
MPPIPETSGFWAYGKLAPYGATGFNVQNREVGPDAVVEVYADGIALWSKPGATFARSVEDARTFMALVTAAYTIVSGRVVEFVFTGWIEATEATFAGTLIGFTVPRFHATDLDPDTERSRDMEVAVGLAAAVFHRGSWRLALRDVYQAYLTLDLSDDGAEPGAAMSATTAPPSPRSREGSASGDRSELSGRSGDSGERPRPPDVEPRPGGRVLRRARGGAS